MTIKSVKYYQTEFRQHVKAYIDESLGDVFLRSEIEVDKDNKSQLKLNRALKVLVEHGELLKVGHGVYAKAEKITIGPDSEIVIPRKPFEEVIFEALDKLGVEWELGEAIQAYNRGESTQIPVELTLKLKSRYRGRLSVGDQQVVFEGDVNAR